MTFWRCCGGWGGLAAVQPAVHQAVRQGEVPATGQGTCCWRNYWRAKELELDQQHLLMECVTAAFSHKRRRLRLIFKQRCGQERCPTSPFSPGGNIHSNVFMMRTCSYGCVWCFMYVCVARHCHSGLCLGMGRHRGTASSFNIKQWNSPKHNETTPVFSCLAPAPAALLTQWQPGTHMTHQATGGHTPCLHPLSLSHLPASPAHQPKMRQHHKLQLRSGASAACMLSVRG